MLELNQQTPTNDVGAAAFSNGRGSLPFTAGVYYNRAQYKLDESAMNLA
ncbi:hypothetical protein [Pseudomonas caspiana]